MCDPVSLALAATAASTAISAGSSIFGGFAQNSADQYAAKVAEQNEQVAVRNSNLTIQAGYDEQQKQYQQVAALKGHQIAAFAAEGLDVGYGSPSDLVGDTATLGEADAQRLRNNNAARANAFLLQANNYSAEAQGDKAAGKDALITGFLKAGSTALSGASSIFGGMPGAGGTASFGKPPGGNVINTKIQ